MAIMAGKDCRIRTPSNAVSGCSGASGSLFGHLALFYFQCSLSSPLAEIEELGTTGLAMLENGNDSQHWAN